MNISFILPTKGRDTLGRTLRSIETMPGDEILIEVDYPPSGKWGNDQRNTAIKRATGDYLAFIDDDDWYVKGHRKIMEKAMRENPGKPNFFKMQSPDGKVLWKEKKLVPGNIGGLMILVPNMPKMLHHWQGGRNMADFIFADKWGWFEDEIIWRDEIIVMLDH